LFHPPIGDHIGRLWVFLFIDMRWLIVFFHVILSSQKADAQFGFSHPHDFGHAGLGWGSLTLSNDTITIFGGIRENSQQAFGLLFSQFDTSGNLIHYKVYNDSMGDNMVKAYPNSFIKLDESMGYAGVGGIFERKFGILALYNTDGTIRQVIEYPDDILQDFYKEIIEVPDGFFVLGDKQLNDYHSHIFLMKTDTEGNKLWEKRYGHPTRENYYGSIVKVNDNEYVIGGFTTLTPVQGQIIKNTSNFYVIDSLGNLKSSWQSQESLNDIGVGFGLHKTEENGWAYATVEGQLQPDGFFERKWTFIKRDSAYNLVTQKSYGAFHNLNWMLNFKQLSNGDYLIIGSNVVRFDPPAQYVALHMGSLLRVSPTGDSIWHYADTAFAAALNVLYDVVELPSGSIIACGYSRTNDPQKDWGWLIKISKDGCVDTLNCFPVSRIGDILVKEQPLKAYPNPTSDFIHLELPEDETSTYQIFSLTGKLVVSGSIPDGEIDVSTLPPGGYVLQIRSKSRALVQKIIKM
jgi:hypothetical protein